MDMEYSTFMYLCVRKKTQTAGLCFVLVSENDPAKTCNHVSPAYILLPQDAEYSSYHSNRVSSTWVASRQARIRSGRTEPITG